MVQQINRSRNLKSIIIESSIATPTFRKRVEIVERKGKGHPDTICDLVMNAISVNLSKLYMKESGTVLHHNVDKALLVAGQAVNNFGGGKLLKPMRLVIGDRATLRSNNCCFPVEEIAVETAESWFKTLRHVRKGDVEYQFEVRPASEQLQSLLRGSRNEIGSNDTSASVGYAPLTDTEAAVLETELYLNSDKFKSQFPQSGEDVKVMGVRIDNSLELTIALAFVDRYINSESNYFRQKEEILQSIIEFQKRNSCFEKIKVAINLLDKKDKGIEGLYLTVLGTSADSSDSGQVGRGNRVNRVISLMRPANSEAAAGKNALSHIGKICNVMSFIIADEIHKKVSGIEEVFVWMYNIIGGPVSRPKAIVVQPLVNDPSNVSHIKRCINDIVEDNLSKTNQLCNRLMLGEMPIA